MSNHLNWLNERLVQCIKSACCPDCAREVLRCLHKLPHFTDICVTLFCQVGPLLEAGRLFKLCSSMHLPQPILLLWEDLFLKDFKAVWSAGWDHLACRPWWVEALLPKIALKCCIICLLCCFCASPELQDSTEVAETHSKLGNSAMICNAPEHSAMLCVPCFQSVPIWHS